MFTFENFLCCFELESGGIFLGWTGIIFYSLFLCILTLAPFFHNSIADGLKNSMSTSHDPYSRHTPELNRRSSDDAEMEAIIGISLGIIIFIAVITYAILCLRLWASISLLNGTKRRNHNLVYKYVVIDGILTAIGALSIFRSAINALDVLITIYLSICTYSLYKKLENESTQGRDITVLYDVATVSPTIIYPMAQNVPQVLTYHQTQANQQPQQYQIPQADQPPPSYQDISKFVLSNQLPSSYSVVPSAPQI